MAANHFFLVNISMIGIILTMIYLALRNHNTFSKRLAKIRVRIEAGSRRQTPESSDEKFEHSSSLDWLVIVSLLLILMLFGALA